MSTDREALPPCLICSREEHEHRDLNGHGYVPARIARTTDGGGS
jgi:hypothetical protein